MYVNNVKLNNTLYSKLKTQLVVDVKKPVNRNISAERLKSKKKLDGTIKKNDGMYTSVFLINIEYIAYIYPVC